MTISAGAIRAGRAFVEIAGEDAMLRRSLKNVGSTIKSFGATVQQSGMGIISAGQSVLQPLLDAADQFTTAGDQLHKMSIRTGVSAQALSELGHAADLSGSNIEQLGAGLFRMRRRIANAATATGPAVRALKEMGLEASELTKLQPEKQFEAMVVALGQVENESRRAQLAFEVFGDGAKALTPLLDSGAEGIEAMREQARRLGITLNDDDALAAANLGDAMDEMQKVFASFTIQVGAAIAGDLTDFAKWVAETINWVSRFIRENRELIVLLLKAAAVTVVAGGAIIALGVTIASVGAIISGFATAISAVGSAIMFLFSPLGILTALIGGLAAWWLMTGDNMSKTTRWLGEQFQWLAGIATEAFGGIMAALKTGDFQAAASIAWMGIKLAFLQGTRDMRMVWGEFVGILQTVWDNLVTRTYQGFVWLGQQMAKIWNAIVSVAKTALEAIGVDTSGMSISVTIDEGRVSRIGAQLAEREQQRQDARMRAYAERDQAIAQLEQDLAAAVTDAKDAAANFKEAAKAPEIPEVAKLIPEVQQAVSAAVAGVPQVAEFGSVAALEAEQANRQEQHLASVAAESKKGNELLSQIRQAMQGVEAVGIVGGLDS